MGKILTGSVIGQGVVLLASPLLTRLYTPSGFGTLAVVTSTSAMVGAVVTLGLERAVPLPRSHTGARALARSAVASLVAWSIVVAIVAYLGRGALAERFSAPGLFDLWWTIPCGAAAIGGQRVVAALLIRHRAHGRIAQRNAVQGIVQVVSGVVLAPTGALGLVLAPRWVGWWRAWVSAPGHVGATVTARYRSAWSAPPCAATVGSSGTRPARH